LRHAGTLAVLAALLIVAAAPSASAQAASTASVEGGVLLVVAGPGEANAVSIEPNPGNGAPQDYVISDSAAGVSAGAGCQLDPHRYGRPAVCSAAGVQSIVVRLGDGNDTAHWMGGSASIPVEIYGEAGNDDLTGPLQPTPGTLVDGGEGDDQIHGSADIARGGPGNDSVIGGRLVEGGDGNDSLFKADVNDVAGRLDGGPGDDKLQSKDGVVDELICGAGNDRVVTADDAERPDASCESGRGVAQVVSPKVTVFELPKLRTRPGKDGRLAVWIACNVPNCAVTVQLRAVGDAGSKNFARFTPRQAPVRRLIAGTQAKLFRLALSSAQRRGLRRVKGPTTVAAAVTATGPGGRTKTFTDGFYCRRSDPC
jgi:hypothetical protein